MRAFCFAFVAVMLFATSAAAGGSLRFFGTGADDVDRVKIPIDPHNAADIGAGDFTIDFWLRASAADNNGTLTCNSVDGWITGNVVIDRDIYGPGPDWGIALGVRSGGGRRIAFGAADATGNGITLCGTSNVADGQWHHIAVQRRLSDGRIWLFVDGQLEATALGPLGSLAYPDGRSTSWPNSDPYLVIGAEKHDAGSAYPSFSGWITELRLSTVLRYPTTTTLGPAFARPNRRHAVDAHTAALYRFQEGAGQTLYSAAGPKAAAGQVRFNASQTRPQWSSEAPFGPAPSCLDLDDNGVVSAWSDGRLLLRALFGLRGAALTQDVLGESAQRTDPQAIIDYLFAQPLDPNTGGPLRATRDGLWLYRVLAGRPDSELSGGLGAADLPSAADLRAFLARHCGLP
ncbi:MAG: LamG-like jellyroll fold domain-containing protein [Burkholderiales bacterium]|nr:LamG-like jellyroll fold domain-containing protein [Burkholderiales bacterium]